MTVPFHPKSHRAPRYHSTLRHPLSHTTHNLQPTTPASPTEAQRIVAFFRTIALAASIGAVIYLIGFLTFIAAAGS